MPSVNTVSVSDSEIGKSDLKLGKELDEKLIIYDGNKEDNKNNENTNITVEDNSALSRSSSLTSISSLCTKSCPSSIALSQAISIPLSKKFVKENGNSGKTFPELLEAFRLSAKESKNPAFRMTYVDYLLMCADKIMDDPESLGIFFDVEDERTPLERQEAMKDTLIAEAMKWLKKLATHGICPYPDAQFLLAEFYGRGINGLKVNHVKAFALYFAASKQGHPPSTYRVAASCEAGTGIKQDDARAIQFYHKAAAAGEPNAMHKYGLMLLYGHLGMRINVKEGISWLKRAASCASVECPESLVELARIFEKDSGCPVVIPDEGFSLELYTQAANLGHAPAQYRLGTIYEFGLLDCASDPTTALKWYAKAADQDFPEAQLALSHWYLTGTPATALDALDDLESHIVIKPSESEAFEWARRAAEQELPKAQYTLGYYFEEGIGCNADLGAALLWYRRSAEQEYHRALKRLAELNVPFKRKKSGKCVIQ